MSEDTPNIATVNGISEFLQKNGLATMLVLAGLWFVVLPLNERYQKMLEEVSQSNTSLSETVKELKEGIVTIGRTNSENVSINQDMLKDIDRRLQDVEEASKEISRKLDDLRGGRGQAYTPPSNFTETDEST
jgi:septation ring formation regulator EzrA